MALLQELATDRLIVFITHRQDLLPYFDQIVQVGSEVA